MNSHKKLSPQTLACHRQACNKKEDGYMDPETGFFVMTSHYLRKQNDCCGNGCRHCPWDKQTQRNAGRDMNAPAYPHPPLADE